VRGRAEGGVGQERRREGGYLTDTFRGRADIVCSGGEGRAASCQAISE